jgi:hypothetical protein
MKIFAFLTGSSYLDYAFFYSAQQSILPFELTHLDTQPSFYKKLGAGDWIGLTQERSIPLTGFDNSVSSDFNSKIVAVFSRRAMQEFHDLLDYPGNLIQTIALNGEPAFFYVYPIAPDCGEPYPTYATLSAYAEQHNLHFFRKFVDSQYVLVTETFRQRFKQAKFKGASFLLKFDGKRSWPKV